jgi:RNA polymerase sigma-70 factor (ECF subfamily)
LSLPTPDPWFADEVLPHEPALRAWLRSRFPALRDVDDLIQETYMRILQVRDRAAIRVPKAFLFAAARNLAVDYARRGHIVMFETMGESEEALLADDVQTSAEAAEHRQKLELLTRAIQELPERCREVLTLRKIYGLSQRDIAARLGISEHTVEAQVGNGVRRCAVFFARHGLP